MLARGTLSVRLPAGVAFVMVSYLLNLALPADVSGGWDVFTHVAWLFVTFFLFGFIVNHWITIPLVAASYWLLMVAGAWYQGGGVLDRFLWNIINTDLGAFIIFLEVGVMMAAAFGWVARLAINKQHLS